MPAIIKVTNLSKQFNEIKAVDGLSFTVDEGDVYGFLGQNGAGKSTTIRMLLTLIKPTSGEISIFGKNLKTHRNQILSEIGAVIERPDLYKYLTAYENLSIFARVSGIKPERSVLMDQLKMVQLHDRAHDKVHTFSQGMKQRLGIAVALVHSPKLIILDEPTNGLDPQGIADMRKLIFQLSRQMGKTILVSSHLLSEIELVANKMLIIHKGKKMIEGKVAELLDPSRSVVNIETVHDESARQVILESSWQKYLQTDARGIQLKMDKEQIPVLVNYLSQSNIQILAVKPSHSLEDYFISLTTPNNHVESPAN